MKYFSVLVIVFCSLFFFNPHSVASPKLKVGKKVTSSKKITKKDKMKKKIMKKININKATAKQLAKLKGIGMEKAKAIIEYRRKHGKFKKYSDLAKVKGISMEMVKKLKPYIRLK